MDVVDPRRISIPSYCLDALDTIGASSIDHSICRPASCEIDLHSYTLLQTKNFVGAQSRRQQQKNLPPIETLRVRSSRDDDDGVDWTHCPWTVRQGKLRRQGVPRPDAISARSCQSRVLSEACRASQVVHQ